MLSPTSIRRKETFLSSFPISALLLNLVFSYVYNCIIFYGLLVCFFLGREDGELGCYALFKNCTYRNNYADEYGAAIGATALNLFESKGETKPAVIVDW